MDLLSLLPLFGYVLAGLSLNMLAEFTVAAAYTRRKVRADTAAQVEAGKAALLAELKPLLAPGAMRGGHDPVAMAERKAQVAEERRQQAIATQVEVKTFIAERFGPERVAQVEALLGEETMTGIYAAGERWKPLLNPLLRRIPPRAQTDPHAETAAPSGFALE